MNETILKLLLGGAIGIICKIIYDKIRENSEKKRIKELLMVEMHSNIENIKSLLSEIKCIDNSPIKEALESYSLEETAKLIDKACKKEILNKCIEKLPYLGKDQMKHVFNFYNAFEDESNFLKNFQRFGGNISVHTNENVARRLISRCENCLSAFEQTKNSA